MANENFSVNMNWSMGSQGGGDPTRYLALPFQARPIHDDQVLLMVAGRTESQRLPMRLAQLLSCCNGLATLDEHARNAAGAMRLPGHQAAGLKQPLRQLVDAGLLANESDLLETLRGTTGSAEPDAPIETLFVRTCARPQTLRRLLDSLARQPDNGDLKRCVVLDDSKEASELEATREAVNAARPSLDIDLHLIDRDDRRAILDKIAEGAACEPETLRWFLEGDEEEDTLTYGAGPNLALLLGAGTRIALMDDDATLDARIPEGCIDRPVFSPEPGDRMQLPDPDSELTGDDGGELERHPLAAHGRYLGQRSGELLDADPGEAIDWLTPDLLDQLARQPRVKLTCSGVLGDPGTEDLQWIYGMPAEDWRDLCTNAEDYRARILQRRVLRCPRRAVATPGYGLMTTTLTGVDNREMLLPTAARERNEDLLLGAMIGYLYPNALHVTLPHALYHMHPEPQHWTEADLDRVRRPGRARYLSAWLEELAVQCRSSDPGERTDMLIAGLHDLARQDRASLKAAIERLQTEARAGLVKRVERTLTELKPPDWLQADFRRVMEAAATVPPDEADRLERIAEKTQRLAEGYAGRLPAWCRAWHHCRETGIESLLEADDD